MNAADWGVVAGSIAAIVWVNWYFFFAEGRPGAVRPGATSDGHDHNH